MPRFRSVTVTALGLGLGLNAVPAPGDPCNNLALICVAIGDNRISILAPGVLIGTSTAVRPLAG